MSVVLYPVKDTPISEFKPDRNYGSDYLRFSESPYNVARAFLGFDITSAPSSGDVTSVMLYMFVRTSSRFFDSPGTIHRITGSWEESTATWNNSRDIATSALVLARTFKHAEYDPIWDSQDVTDLYKESKDAGGVFDLQLRTEELYQKNHSRGNDFDSRERRVYYDGEPYSLEKPYLLIEYEEALPLAFADVAISRRYGSRLYLSGSINDIVASDEICVYYVRPGGTGIRNLKSDSMDYLYFKGASGSYDLGANNRYIEFERAGYHWLQIWDISGNCETPITKRAEWLMNIVLPRYQYQVIFDLADQDLGDNLWRLEAEYAKYEAAGSWFVHHEKPDCFERIQPIWTPEDDTPQSGWLSLGVEFGESPCAPIPYYLCPLPTPQTQYWRGECSCDLFLNTLQPLGIPCSHLIAAMNWYSGKPAWSNYVQCP